MAHLSVFTTRDMLLSKNKNLTSSDDSKPAPSGKSRKKNRKWKNRTPKSVAKVDESVNSDSPDDDSTSKTANGKGIKSSTKSTDASSLDSDTKTISKDRLLLIEKQVKSTQAEFDERHRFKVSGEKGVLQSSVHTDPNATKNFGVEQVTTRFSHHLPNLEVAKAAQIAGATHSKEAKSTKNGSYSMEAAPTEKASTSGRQQSSVEIDYKRFKIPKGAA